MKNFLKAEIPGTQISGGMVLTTVVSGLLVGAATFAGIELAGYIAKKIDSKQEAKKMKEEQQRVIDKKEAESIEDIANSKDAGES